MRLMKQIIIGMVIVTFCLAGNAGAEKRTPEPGSFLGVAVTTSQTAVFAAFLSSINGGVDGDTAISVTNILGTPPNIPSVNGDDKSDREGALWVYLLGGDGERYVFESETYPNVGLGLDENGVLREGHTWRVLLSQIIRAALGFDQNFSGAAWVVAGFDGVAGTYTNFFTGIGGGFGAVMEPALGGLDVDVEKTGGKIQFEIPLSGDQENPPVDTTSSGMCMATLNTNQTQFSITCMHDVAAVAAHIHRAPAGTNGGVVFPFSDPSSPFSAVWNLSADNLADLLAGDLYVNVHSAANPGGEIRGQIIPPNN